MKITSEKELREIYPPAKGKVTLKQLEQLEKHSINFINHAPFVVLSTSNIAGKLDSSPRGGEPGFVKIIDHKTLLIPDVKGNNLIDSLINITENPHLSCIFLIPGVNETLRVNGRAEITTDSEYLELCVGYGDKLLSVIKIEIEEVCLHCAKALMRSRLWQEEAKIDRTQFPSMGRMINDQLNDSSVPESQEAMVERYKRDL